MKRDFIVRELSLSTWPDFEKLAMKQGQCWCMYYHRPRPVRGKLSTAERGSMNKREKEVLVQQGQSHASLVYDGKTPIGWCQYGPKEELPRIDASRNYKKLGPRSGSKRLWRITCFFVDKEHRGQGVARTALRAALESIRKQGGGIVEAYPVVSENLSKVPEWMWFGSPSMFRRERFKQVAQLGKSYQLMRRTILPG
ncbi:MAG TPA: GNAT family N-acetyltransferase [Candidatus Bathyarchaeia archaeon]|nr:GNAT family N-acetyltransferase [Candidatus Bathyarchaeia archaeon]